MKKLIIYIPSIEGGGVEKNLYYISNYLSKKNIDIYIVTANTNHKKFFNNKIKYICPDSLKWNNSSRFIKTLICLALIIKKLPLKNISILSFQSNVSAIILSKLFNLKIIIRLNTSTDKYIKNLIKKFFFKTIYSMSDMIIVNSLEFKRNLHKVLKINSIQIFNSIKYKDFNKKLRIDYFKNFSGIKILSIGRLTDQKDQITILKCLNILKNKEINFRFYLIGEGYKLNMLKQYVKDQKLSKNVKFAGYKSNAFKYIQSADLFVLSSKYEGLPNVLIEAQSLNVPIISSDCSTGPKEILLQGKLGYLFKVGNYLSMSKLIIDFSKDKKKFLYKAKLAKKYLYRFSYEKNLSKYYNIINKIL
jgi:glycosyltransferase involved in cell wall biosynthesis